MMVIQLAEVGTMMYPFPENVRYTDKADKVTAMNSCWGVILKGEKFNRMGQSIARL